MNLCKRVLTFGVLVLSGMARSEEAPLSHSALQEPNANVDFPALGGDFVEQSKLTSESFCVRRIDDKVPGQPPKVQIKFSACNSPQENWTELEIGPKVSARERILLYDGIEVGILEEKTITDRGTSSTKYSLLQLCTGLFHQSCRFQKDAASGELVGLENSLYDGRIVEQSTTKVYSRGNDDEELGEGNYETARVMARTLVVRDPTTGKRELMFLYSGQLPRFTPNEAREIGQWGLSQKENSLSKASPTLESFYITHEAQPAPQNPSSAWYFGKLLKLGDVPEDASGKFSGQLFVEGQYPSSPALVELGKIQQQRLQWTYDAQNSQMGFTLEQQDVRKFLVSTLQAQGQVAKASPGLIARVSNYFFGSKKTQPVAVPMNPAFTPRADFLPMVYSSAPTDKVSPKLPSREEHVKLRLEELIKQLGEDPSSAATYPP